MRSGHGCELRSLGGRGSRWSGPVRENTGRGRRQSCDQVVSARLLIAACTCTAQSALEFHTANVNAISLAGDEYVSSVTSTWDQATATSLGEDLTVVRDCTRDTAEVGDMTLEIDWARRLPTLQSGRQLLLICSSASFRISASRVRRRSSSSAIQLTSGSMRVPLAWATSSPAFCASCAYSKR